MIEFWVPGDAVPQGSHRAFIRGGRAVLVSRTRPLIAWREAIAFEARGAMRHLLPSEDPMYLVLEFYRAPIKDKRKMLLPPATRPDIDKLVRAALDALTGVVYRDDSQVVSISATKHWGSPGLSVRATTHEEERSKLLLPSEQQQLP